MIALDAILVLFGIPWLGHGRRAEFLLACASALYATLLLFVSNASEHSQATVSLFWEGHGRLLFYPLAINATLSGYGLVANVNVWRWSRMARFTGAFFGFIIWLWFAVKFYALGACATPGFVFSCVAVYACVGIMVLSVANVPRPGAPGNVQRGA